MASTASSSSGTAGVDSQSLSALVKLGFFTVAMVVGPIATYFLSLNHLWGPGNTTSAAVSAAVVANLVVFAYILVALSEDKAERQQGSRLDEKKKE